MLRRKFSMRKRAAGGWGGGNRGRVAYHWENCPFPCFPSSSALKVCVRWLLPAQRVNFQLILTLAGFFVWNWIELLLRKNEDEPIKFNDQPGLRCKLQIETFLIKLKLTLEWFRPTDWFGTHTGSVQMYAKTNEADFVNLCLLCFFIHTKKCWLRILALWNPGLKIGFLLFKMLSEALLRHHT